MRKTLAYCTLFLGLLALQSCDKPGEKKTDEKQESEKAATLFEPMEEESEAVDEISDSTENTPPPVAPVVKEMLPIDPSQPPTGDNLRYQFTVPQPDGTTKIFKQDPDDTELMSMDESE